MQMRLINGHVVDPVDGIDGVGDIGISDGLFVPPETLVDPEVVDLKGLVVAPGFVDLHVHLRDPGQTDKEDLHTGAAAAAAGGFTTIVAMPNTVPAIDSPERLAAVARRQTEVEGVRVLQAATLTRGRSGAELADIAELAATGAAALTDDGSCLSSARRMREAMQLARDAGLGVMDHCEDASLAEGTAVYESATARELNLPARTPVAEELVVARDILLCRDTGCPVHIQHVSTRGAVELVRRARADGLPVTAEATPHHLLLTHEAIRQAGALAKMNPPLGSEDDRQALIEGLNDGTITVIATDHAPHAVAEKKRGFVDAPFGIVGLETAVPLCCAELVGKGCLAMWQLIGLFTAGPRNVLGLSAGTMQTGAPADCTILDMNAEWEIRPDEFRSKARNTPFAGWRGVGRAVATLVGGRFVTGIPRDPTRRG